MARMLVLLAGLGLIFAFIVMVGGRFDSYAVQVTFFGGGVPTYDPSNFENCGPKWSANAFTGSGSSSFVQPPKQQTNRNCYAYLRQGANAPMECDYSLGFRAGDSTIQRLRVKVAIMHGGKEKGRRSLTIDSLARPADSPYVAKSIRGECNADQLRVVEAHAYVNGQETDLITAGNIASKSMMPFFSDTFVQIASPTGA